MNTQVREQLVLNGAKISIDFYPGLPQDHPRIVNLRPSQTWCSACWRGYIGSWEIKDQRLYLVGLRGNYELRGEGPLFADWFTGTMKVTEGEVVRHEQPRHRPVFEQETHIDIDLGEVLSLVTLGNRNQHPRKPAPDLDDAEGYVFGADSGTRNRADGHSSSTAGATKDFHLEPEEEAEFALLLAEMKPLQFTDSAAVSRYIMKNRLGQKYQNVSGVVKMARDGTTWDFNGGFPPRIYRALCLELGLRKEHTRVSAIGFKSFKTLGARD
jgi:hypothetical protein